MRHSERSIQFLSVIMLAGGSLLSSCSDTGSVTLPVVPPAAASQWVVAWGASPENAVAGAENPGGSEQSFRNFFYPTVAGTEERVHFTNVYGTTPITIGAARLSAAGAAIAPAVDATRDVALTFSGASSVTIPAGGTVTSDPVNITYSFGEKLAVSDYVMGTFPALTQHESQVNTNYATAAGGGNTTSDTTGTAFTSSNTEWYLLSGVDVYGGYSGTVAIFGSSSVDGHASNDGDTNSYPVANTPVAGQDNDRPSDWLARELIAGGYNLGVLNAGTIGDPAGEDSRTASGISEAGVDRMSRDVLTQAGVKAVIIYFGGVDLRADCNTAASVEASLTNMISQANAVGLRVIVATLPPAEYCLYTPGLVPTTADPYLGDINPGPENPGSTQRNLLNTWIRTTAVSLPGVVAIADFDLALLYPPHPDFMMPMYNSGDNFHPNGAGYGVQSGAIPLSAILGH